MTNNIKSFLNKINPFDYKENPIGALKTELAFWFFFLTSINFLSGYTEAINKTLEKDLFYFPFYILFIFTIIGWSRICILITRYLKEKEEKVK